MTLLYFSPVAWDSYEQRPHYFARDFLATGGDAVVWINPYAARLPRVADVTRVDLRQPPMRLARPAGLTVIEPGGLPIDPLPGGRWINRRLLWHQLLARLATDAATTPTIIGIGRPTALALTAITAVRAESTFYDAMDDFPEFYRGRSRTATRAVESQIAAHVNRIFVSSTHLHRKFTGVGPPVTLLRNGYDMALLPPYSSERPANPQLGFVGTVGSWFDWPMVLRLAHASPTVPITVAGPIAVAIPRALPANIRLLPACSQPDSARLLSSFTAGLIPFIKNALTQSVDPIKYYQYRGAGLPILTTRFGEMATRGQADSTFFLDDEAGIPAALEAASADRQSPADVARFRAEHTWAARFSDAAIWRHR